MATAASQASSTSSAWSASMDAWSISIWETHKKEYKVHLNNLLNQHHRLVDGVSQFTTAVKTYEQGNQPPDMNRFQFALIKEIGEHKTAWDAFLKTVPGYYTEKQRKMLTRVSKELDRLQSQFDDLLKRMQAAMRRIGAGTIMGINLGAEAPVSLPPSKNFQ